MNKYNAGICCFALGIIAALTNELGASWVCYAIGVLVYALPVSRIPEAK